MKVKQRVPVYPKDKIDQWHASFGICTRCGEHTNLLLPCCGTGVVFEGDTWSPHELWNSVCDCNQADTCQACVYINALDLGDV